jgi:hypothetical protein
MTGRNCSMCGEPAHETKAEVLACSGNRRREFAEQSKAMAKIRADSAKAKKKQP